jgi:hypothetical protein
MTIYLKQSTASQEVLLGMFLDSTDGTTPKTGLTIANTDINIWKAGGTSVAAKNSGGATEIGTTGRYYAVFDATDTDTLGSMIIDVKVAGALYMRLEAAVLTANVYDSWFGADVQDVSVTQIAGSAVDAATPQLGVNVVNWKGSAAAAMTGDAYARLGAPAGASVSADVAAMKVDTAAILVDTAVIGALGAGLTAIPWNAAWDAEVQSEVTDALNAYDPPTKTEMDTGLDALPTAAEVKTAIEAAGGHLALILEDTGTTLPSSLSAISGYIDTEVASILAAVDTEVAAILADTNELQTDLVNGGRLDLLIDAIKAKTDVIPASPATEGTLTTVAGYLDTEIAAILADTNELQTDWANGGRLDLILDAASAPTAAAVADAVWDEVLHTDHEVAGSASVLLQGATAPSSADVADAVWNELVADHSGVGSAGAALAAAGGTGDPWSTALPGSYGAGTAGKIIGDNINAPVGTVDTVADNILTMLTDIHNTDLPAVKTDTGNLITQVGDVHATDLPAVKTVVDAIKTVVDNVHDTDLPAVKSDTAAILTDTGTTLDTLLKDIPTVAEFEARSLPAADYVVVGDTIARVTLVDTCTTNTDMRGTNSAALASVCTEGRLAELDAANLPADVAAVKAETAGIIEDTGTTLPATLAALPTADSIHDEVVEGTTTLRQAVRLMLAVLTGKASGGATTAITYRDIGDTKDRVVATVDSDGNRTAVTRDGS